MTAIDIDVERATLGGLLMIAESRAVSGVIARGLRPEHFVGEFHRQVFAAIVSLVDRNGAIDPITVAAESERLSGVNLMLIDIETLTGYVPAAGHYSEYADRVIELARWRDRARVIYEMQESLAKRDQGGWSRAVGRIDSSTASTRTDSLSPEAWGSVLWEYYSMSDAAALRRRIPLPWSPLTEAFGGGLELGESCALSGATNHGKSLIADQWLDFAAARGFRCHLYATEMTFVNRGMRLIARATGIPFMKQRRRRDLTDGDRAQVLEVIQKMPYGMSIVTDWDIDDVVRDALRARYDFVVIDLLHGFHYQDERDMDRLSKAVQRLARVSTTLNGHGGTAVVAVTHLKEEGVVKGKVPRPTVASMKHGSSIKQDCDFVMMVWQDQDERGEATGEGEIWLPKARSGERYRIDVRLNPSRFRFDLRADDDLAASAPRSASGSEMPF